jgi:hypothetical protein
MPVSSPVLVAVESLQNIMVSRAEGGAGDPTAYKALRIELLGMPEIAARLPRWVTTCRDQHQFWTFIKGQFGTYQERRRFIWDGFAPVMSYLEQGERAPADLPILDVLQAFNAEEIGSIWKRALDRRATDPEGAITIARTLLETVCKHIIEDCGGSFGASDDLPKLYHGAAQQLGLAPSQHTEEVFKQILGGCQSVVNGLGALRNRLGDAHGKSKLPVRPAARHAGLAVNLAGAMATFLIDTWKARSVG